MVFGATAVSIHILNADRYRVRSSKLSGGFVLAQFPQRDGPVAYVHLYAMISDAQAHGESEGCAQPVGGLIYIGIREVGDNGRRLDGPVGENTAPPRTDYISDSFAAWLPH